MSWQNNLKNIYISSSLIPRVYTFFTKPFSRIFRHLEPTPSSAPSRTLKKITAVVPNYNYARFLPRRIESILSQTYPVSELIILDDASTDDSDEIIESLLEKFQKKYKNITFSYIKNPKNTGKPISQWGKAFDLAHGDYIWIAEADDYSDKFFLATVMPAFDDEEVIMSYSNSVAVNKNDSILSYDFAMHAGKLNKSHFKSSYINDGKREIEEVLKHRCTIPNVSAVVFRKAKSIPFTKYLEEAKKFTQVGDWYFYLSVLAHGKISFTRQSLNFFRLSSGSVTSKSRNSEKHQKEIVFIKSIWK